MSTDSQARVYRGSTVHELIPRIQRELGPDAIILRRREGLTGGILGFFQRSFVEIEAVRGGPRIDVYDEGDDGPIVHRSPPPGLPLLDLPRAAAPSHQPLPVPPVGARTAPALQGRALTAHGAYVTEQLAALAMAGPAQPLMRPGEAAVGHPRDSSHPTSPRSEPPRESALDSFAAALASAEAERGQVETGHAPARSALPPTQTGPTPARAAPAAPQARAVPVPPPVRPMRSSPKPDPWSVPPAPRGARRAGISVERRLVGFGMSERFARELIEAARAHVLPLTPGAGLTRGVRAALAQRIPVAPPLPVAGAAIVVVGAGGSGKTSSCAALMRAYRRASALPSGYAALAWESERPGLHVLLSPHVMRPTPIDAQRAHRAVRRVRGEGLLVIDTPRLSPADKAGVHELANFLGELAAQRVVIALPATLGATAAAQLLEALRPLGANSLVVTHADETDQIGVAVEVACAFGLAPEYRLDRNRSGAWRIGRMDPAGLAERLLP